MSATNRGGPRVPADNYPTPTWCVQRLLEAVDLPGGEWLEPAVGEGAIIQATDREDVTWTAVDVRPEAVQSVAGLVTDDRLYQGDFLSLTTAGTFEPKTFSVVLTNPPYRQAMEYVQACLPLAGTVVMLLRLSFLATKGRYEFMNSTKPDVHILASRPCFVNGKSDSSEYGWFIWRDEPPTEGRHTWLAPKS